MFKNDIEIEYKQAELTAEELESRLLKALNLLMNYENIYENSQR